MSTNGDTEHTEDYQKVLDYGIEESVAKELDNVFKEGIMSHSDLDERALDALKEFAPDKGVAVLKEFRESNLEHVSNKSAYLCGVMKAYRQKMKMQGGTTSDSSAKKPGPDEAKIKEILERTGYALDVTVGQRKYGGPPPEEEYANQPGAGHEVFCGKIPREVFEDELIPLFEKCGTIWDLRLMIDPMTGYSRGYCFVTFVDKSEAQECVKQLDNYEIKPGKRIKCNVSVANLRLFVGNIPKSKSKEEIQSEFSQLTDNLNDVIIYSSVDNPNKKNRGFAFLEYTSHKDASIAKRRIGNGRTRVWGCDIIVDWADPLDEPDEEAMSKVKVLYVRNVQADITEEKLKEAFEPYGKIERVKKVKDFGFIHFENRDDALQAMEAMNGQSLGDVELDVSLAKPTSEAKQKKKQQRQEMNMARGGQFGNMMGGPGGYMDSYGFGGGPMGGGRMGRGGMARGGGAGRFDYDDFGYGYGFDGYDDGYGGYGGYDDFSMGGGGGFRGRGGRGGMMMSPRGRGMFGGNRGAAMRARGRAGQALRGQGRGGMMPRGGGGGGMRGRGGALRGQKRKMDGVGAGGAKKRNTQGDSWGSQPIAQQPLRNQQWF